VAQYHELNTKLNTRQYPFLVTPGKLNCERILKCVTFSSGIGWNDNWVSVSEEFFGMKSDMKYMCSLELQISQFSAAQISGIQPGLRVPPGVRKIKK
jgi:hypothetical protein